MTPEQHMDAIFKHFGVNIRDMDDPFLIKAVIASIENAMADGAKAMQQVAAEGVLYWIACSICLEINGCKCDFEKAMSSGPCTPPADKLAKAIMEIDVEALAKGIM